MKAKKNRETQQIQVNDGAYTNFVSNLNTVRDKASYGHFSKDTIGDDELEAVYQDWLAKKIINRPVLDMLRAGWYYTGLSDKQMTQLENECTRLKLIERLAQLLIFTRLYGVAYLLIGVADGQDLTQPLNAEQLKQGSLKYFLVLKKQQVYANHREYLSLEESMGELKVPMFYEIRYGDGLNHQTLKVHHSRLWPIKQNEDMESVLLSIYHTLRHFASTNAGAASLVHEAKIDVIRVPSLTMEIINRGRAIFERFSAAALMKSINGMLVLDKEEEYDNKSYSFGGLPELMREFALQTAGASDIPFTILFGQTTSGLNNSGEHDTRNYYDMIATHQAWQLRPILRRILELIIKSLFGKVPTGFNFAFNTLWQLDHKTRAEVEKLNAERDAQYLQMGVINEAMIAKQLDQDGTYDFIDEAHIKLLDELQCSTRDFEHEQERNQRQDDFADDGDDESGDKAQSQKSPNQN